MIALRKNNTDNSNYRGFILRPDKRNGNALGIVCNLDTSKPLVNRPRSDVFNLWIERYKKGKYSAFNLLRLTISIDWDRKALSRHAIWALRAFNTYTLRLMPLQITLQL